jgi:hypothetical protein
VKFALIAKEMVPSTRIGPLSALELAAVKTTGWWAEAKFKFEPMKARASKVVSVLLPNRI